jgi:uncharacterized protein with NRDE domain
MCVVALAWKAHPRWQLVLIGNRDEFHARPAAALSTWAEAPHVLAGRDLRSGGSWLGVSEHGRLAVVTNLRGFGDPVAERASRGALVADYLQRGALPSLSPDAYNPFNLWLVDTARARFLTNRPQTMSTELAPGIHSLSNGTVGEIWPRKDRLEAGLGDWLAGDADQPERLLELLQAEDIAGETTPVFIRDAVYGTRCSTIILINGGHNGYSLERRFGPGGAVAGETALTFHWPRASK